ncbi:aldehyde dehydrogenase family protein [Actinomycetospora flava]|uniref:Aldehyde dehydrogenase family protein n=1 Tax=Actinomycetospora flava TaxID=3129232 RepID=A0ABU8M550_9PSEU
MSITASTSRPPAQPQSTTRTRAQLIGGEWLEAADGATFDVTNPLDNSIVTRVPASSRVDMARAVAAAHQAQPGWAAMAPAHKQALFAKAADILESRTPEIVAMLADETGSGAGFGYFQLSWSVSLLRAAAGWVYHPHGQLLRSDYPGTIATAERKPLGVVASFTPWNGAHCLAWRAVVAPLVAGNTVVVKPSEEAPVTAGLLVGEILHDAGFPAGTVNVVTHAGAAAAEVAEEFYDNPAVRCLYFTGSAKTARVVAARAAQALKRSVLELGGYNQIVVTEDADLDHAAKTVAFSAFFHQGQICMNARRVLVAQSVYQSFLDKLTAIAQAMPIGDPSDPSTVIGPLINDAALSGTRAAIEGAVRDGARVHVGGSHDGRLFAPTVLVDVPDHAELSCEETFGPVLVVRPINNDEEGIALVNANPYGLSFSVLTGDPARGMSICSRIDSGAVHVNSPTINDEPHAPNGGTKNSGWGRSGLDALDDFTEIRWMTVEAAQRALPF